MPSQHILKLYHSENIKGFHYSTTLLRACFFICVMEVWWRFDIKGERTVVSLCTIRIEELPPLFNTRPRLLYISITGDNVRTKFFDPFRCQPTLENIIIFVGYYNEDANLTVNMSFEPTCNNTTMHKQTVKTLVKFSSIWHEAASWTV